MDIIFKAKGNYDPTNLDESLFQEVKSVLYAGLESGFSVLGADYSTPDLVLIDKLKENLNVFTGFKTYQQLKEMNDLLITADNKLKSFSDFKADVLALHKTYNTDYLLAEYNLAVASGQAAARWQQIENDRDILPNLTYVTAGDSNVRPSHRVLNKITLPIDHPFWSVNYPPNGWNCRCDVQQTDEPADLKGKNVDDLPLPDAPMFQNNVGKSGVAFPFSHPYYNVSERAGTKVIESIERIADKK